MPEDAKGHWKRVVGDLKPLGLLARVDINTLARYCILFERWLVAMRFVHQFGDTLTIRDTENRIVSIRTMPQSRILRELSVDLLRMEREFGMTPSARASFGMDMNKVSTHLADPKGKDRFFAS
jgi:P27 family predicted phage terminase small subunit